MTEKREFGLLSIWKRATPLKEARLKFAPEALIIRLNEIPEVKFSDSIQAFFGRAGQTHADRMAETQSAIKTMEEVGKIKHEILREIDRNFFKLIDNREVRCFGFEHPRSITSEPIEMLPEYWDFHPNWEKGEYRQAGLHVIELRVIRADHAGQPVQPMIKPPTAAPGRPNFEAAILEAFWALHSKNMIVIKPLSTTINLIRAWIKENLPDTKAAKSQLSDDTIRNALKPVLKNLSAGKVEKL